MEHAIERLVRVKKGDYNGLSCNGLYSDLSKETNLARHKIYT